MANNGFNAATDIFSMGDDWGVRSANENRSGSTAECPNSLGDIAYRDQYADRVAPSAEYVLEADVDELPDLGTVVTIGSHKVAINSIVIKTAKGAAPTASVSGVQVNDDATTKRTYSCGTIALSARHRAQDILGLFGQTVPQTITEATYTFTCDITLADPKGTIENFDVSNGKVVASFTHTTGDGTTAAAPSVSGTTKVVSAPVTKDSPENDYTTTTYSITDSLTGEDAAPAAAAPAAAAPASSSGTSGT